MTTLEISIFEKVEVVSFCQLAKKNLVYGKDIAAIKKPEASVLVRFTNRITHNYTAWKTRRTGRG
jgi:hypothetical protein